MRRIKNIFIKITVLLISLVFVILILEGVLRLINLLTKKEWLAADKFLYTSFLDSSRFSTFISWELDVSVKDVTLIERNLLIMNVELLLLHHIVIYIKYVILIMFLNSLYQIEGKSACLITRTKFERHK